MSEIFQSNGDWQSGFVQILSTVETHAKARFRRLPFEQREDAVQEAIASACVSYPHGPRRSISTGFESVSRAEFVARQVERKDTA